jgi:hypothetical protein
MFSFAKTLVNIYIRQSILTSCALDANCESETPQRIVCDDHVTCLAAWLKLLGSFRMPQVVKFTVTKCNTEWG